MICLSLSACEGLVVDEENLAMQAEFDAYSTEAVVLRQQMQVDQTVAANTVAIASTQAAQYSNYNRILQPTADVIVPQPTRIPADELMSMMGDNVSGPMPIELFDLSDGQTRFVQVGTAGEIDGNRCFLAHQAFFNPNTTNVIYMTALGLNVYAGTSLRVEWRMGGELVHTTNWSAPQSVDGQCVALELTRADADLMPGNWTATLYVNGEPIDPAPFTITSGM